MGRIMSSSDRTRPTGQASGEPVSAWAVAAIVSAVLAVLTAGAVVVGLMSESDDTPSATRIDVSTTPPSVVEVDSSLPATNVEDEEIVPTGRIGYVTADGRVLVGMGSNTPVQVAADAAIGEAALGSVAVAPTSDLVAYVRADGALVTVPTGGGTPTVLATDVPLEVVGRRNVISWDSTGTQVAYVAIGTEAMARPRPVEDRPLSGPDVYRVPLPEGVLGHVVKVVDRTGAEITRIGDPSTRSMVSVATSQSDDLMILESVAPDTGRPYTLALATSGAAEELPTVLSADEPMFSPDGNFVIAVGPDKSGQELLRIATDELSRSTLVSTDRICNPTISPDSTRIVYGTGEDCARLHLISSRGGRPVDITPPARPGDASFEAGQLGWTAEGRFITFADCRAIDGPVECSGPITFLDPDQRLALVGPDATTVAPVRLPLLQPLELRFAMSGPIEYSATFPITADVEGEANELSEGSGRIDLTVTDEERSLSIEMQGEEGSEFAVGRLTIVDPEAGLDHTFMAFGSPSVIGIRVVSLSGIWMSTDDLPFATGEFRLAATRG